jgi:hypothetical protein
VILRWLEEAQIETALIDPENDRVPAPRFVYKAACDESCTGDERSQGDAGEIL